MKPFKRDKDRQDAPYYVKFMVRRKQYLWCTKTNDIRLAERRGKQHRELIKAERYELADRQKARQPHIATLAELFAAYDGAAASIQKATRTKNKRSLLALFDASEKDQVTMLAHTADIETRAMAPIALEADEAVKASRKRSYNSMLQQAQSVFARRYLPAYKRLNLPDLTPLMTLPPVRVNRDPWVAPPQSVIRAIHRGLAELEAQRDPRALVILLDLYAGLRSKEILHARWEWIGEAGIRIAPDREFSIKGFASRVLPLAPEVRARLEALRTTTDYIIPGATKTDRHDLVYRDTPQWVRSMGITDKKPVHAMRKLFGSVVASEQGLYAAQRALGHSSPQVTSDYYADLVVPLRAVVHRVSAV